MHNAEGIKSTPRTADGLCRRVTINVHRPNTPPGAPGENKPEKVDCTSRIGPLPVGVAPTGSMRAILSKHAVRENVRGEKWCPLPRGGGARAEQGRWAAAAQAGAPAGAAAVAAASEAQRRLQNRAAGSWRQRARVGVRKTGHTATALATGNSKIGNAACQQGEGNCAADGKRTWR